MKILNWYQNNLRDKPRSLQIAIKLQVLVVALMAFGAAGRLYFEYLNFSFFHGSNGPGSAIGDAILWSAPFALVLMTLLSAVSKVSKRVWADAYRKMLGTPEALKESEVFFAGLPKLKVESAIAIASDVVSVSVCLLTVYFLFRPDVTLWLSQAETKSLDVSTSSAGSEN